MVHDIMTKYHELGNNFQHGIKIKTVEEHVRKKMEKTEKLESDHESLCNDDSELSFFTADY